MTQTVAGSMAASSQEESAVTTNYEEDGRSYFITFASSEDGLRSLHEENATSMTVPEIKAEAEALSAMLDRKETGIAEIEMLITRLGMSIARLAEERIGFTDAKYRELVTSLLNNDDRQIPSSFFWFGGWAGDKLSNKRALDFYHMTVKALNKGYLSVLQDIRELGGNVDFTKKSHPAAVAMFRKTVDKNYPSDWIASGNQTYPLRAYKCRKGGSYMPVRKVLDPTESPKFGRYTRIEAVLPVDKVEEYIAALSENGDTVEYLTGTPHADYDTGQMVQFITHRHRFPFGTKKSHKMGKDGKPKGDGWFYGKVSIDSETGLQVSQNDHWYRYEATKNLQPGYDFTAHAYINTRGDRIGESSAYHEYAHHVEYSHRSGIIMELEEAFLIRRTTLEDGTRNPLVEFEAWDKDEYSEAHRINPQTRSVVRHGNFASEYVGREYLTEQAREVFTVGMEAIFAGDSGALRGLGCYPADLDHRGFALGLLAVV